MSTTVSYRGQTVPAQLRERAERLEEIAKYLMPWACGSCWTRHPLSPHDGIGSEAEWPGWKAAQLAVELATALVNELDRRLEAELKQGGYT